MFSSWQQFNGYGVCERYPDYVDLHAACIACWAAFESLCCLLAACTRL